MKTGTHRESFVGGRRSDIPTGSSNTTASGEFWSTITDVCTVVEAARRRWRVLVRVTDTPDLTR